jgi:AraC-like DNA-binding protein
MTIFAPALGMIWKGVEAYGLDPLELFREAGIDPSLRTDITARVSQKQADDLLFLASQKSKDDAFVFHIAVNLMPSFMGALGLAWVTSATLRKAFERLQRYGRMVVEYLARVDRDDIVSRARAEILDQLPSGTASLESVASALNVSTRTLIRKLGDENESFKNLLATIRRELGEKYVLDKGLSLTEISFLLGFSETSSFSRAYKNWTGQSPRAHRASM